MVPHIVLGSAKGGDYGASEKLAKLTRTHTVYAVFNDFRGGHETDYGFDSGYARKSAIAAEKKTGEPHFVRKLPASLWKKVERKPNPTRKPAAKRAGRKSNPVPLNESDAAQVKQLRARIKEIDAQVLRAIDSRNWTTADRLDRDRVKLWKMVDKIEGVKRNHNPAKKPAAKRAYVNRPSQATKKPPTQRLKTRRAANVRGSGMFPNPAPKKRGLVRSVSRSAWGPGKAGEFEVYTAPGAAHSDPSQQRLGDLLARFKSKALAIEFAQAYANAKNKRVIVTGY